MTRSRRRRGRGGQRGHEPPLRIRQREQEVAELSAAGRSQREIAQTLGITQPAVSKILKRLDTQWLRQNQDFVAQKKAEAIRELDYVRREAIRAWEASKAQHTRRRQRKTGGDVGPGGTMAEVIVDDSHGDPRFLEAARRAAADKVRLLGKDVTDLASISESARKSVHTLNGFVLAIVGQAELPEGLIVSAHDRNGGSVTLGALVASNSRLHQECTC